MVTRKVKIATCQFAVSSSIAANARHIREFLRKAKKTRADIVHFSECALSGYAGVDMENLATMDWELLKKETENIMALAGKLGIWVVLGNTHRLTEPNKPHNSLHLINPKGKIVDRYDKRFCIAGDLEHYTPGNRAVTFTVNGVKCALLICFDLRFPEIYRDLRKQGVDCVLQSFYNARQKGPSVHTHIMRQTMQCRAATNYFWVSMANSTGRYCPYPSCFIRPDGEIIKSLQQHRAGMMVNTAYLNKKLYDPSADFRDLAIAGALTNGPKKINDPRSKNTTAI